MADSMKNKTLRGLFWSGIDKMSFEIIQFTVGVVMARLLSPSDYGVLGILLVFISFSTLFIDGGLTSALIQKNNRTEKDFNTAFVYNIVMSIFLYLCLFFTAPLISIIYNNHEIALLLRVLSLNLIISAFSSVQNTKFVIAVDFKKISIVSIISGIVSGIIGICFALAGYGVWALVLQQISGNILKTILLIILTDSFPMFMFSKSSFQELFGFGSNLILTNVLARVYDNLYPLIIGKMCPIKTLGFYTRAHQYAILPVNVLKDMFMRVTFPIMSSIKDDSNKLRTLYSLYIECSSFVVFPIMFALIIIARPLINIMLTDKWNDTVPFLQLLCVGFMFSHISAINLNLLFVKGRSDLALKLEVVKKSVAVSILLFSMLWGVWGICIGQAMYGILATLLNSLYTKRLIGLSFIDQIKDFGKIWIIGLFSLVIPYFLIHQQEDCFMQICIGLFFYSSIYIFLNWICMTRSFTYCKRITFDYVKKNSTLFSKE